MLVSGAVSTIPRQENRESNEPEKSPELNFDALFANATEISPDVEAAQPLTILRRTTAPDGKIILTGSLEQISGDPGSAFCVVTDAKDPQNYVVHGDRASFDQFHRAVETLEAEKRDLPTLYRDLNLPYGQMLSLAETLKKSTPNIAYKILHDFEYKNQMNSELVQAIIRLKATLLPEARLIEILAGQVYGPKPMQIFANNARGYFIRGAAVTVAVLSVAAILAGCGVKLPEPVTVSGLEQKETALDPRILMLKANGEPLNPLLFEQFNGVLKAMDEVKACKLPTQPGSIPIIFVDKESAKRYFPEKFKNGVYANAEIKFGKASIPAELYKDFSDRYTEEELLNILQSPSNVEHAVIFYYTIGQEIDPVTVFVLPHELAHGYCGIWSPTYESPVYTDPNEGIPTDIVYYEIDGEGYMLGYGTASMIHITKLFLDEGQPLREGENRAFFTKVNESGETTSISYIYSLKEKDMGFYPVFDELYPHLINRAVLKKVGYSDTVISSFVFIRYDQGILEFVSLLDSHNLKSPVDPNKLYSRNDLVDYAAENAFNGKGFIEYFVGLYAQQNPNATIDQINGFKHNLIVSLVDIYREYLRPGY